MGRALLAIVPVGAVSLGLWQVRPILVWRFTVRPEIVQRGNEDRIRMPIEYELPSSQTPRWEYPCPPFHGSPASAGMSH